MAFGRYGPQTFMMVSTTIVRSVLAVPPLLMQPGDAQIKYGTSSASMPGAQSFVAPSGYPTKAFSSYYPSPSGQEPQPKIYDPVLNITFPANLTNPDTLPDHSDDPLFFPEPKTNLSASEQAEVISDTLRQVKSIIASPSFSTNCSKCIAALEVAQKAAWLAPKLIPNSLVSLCNETGFHSASACEEDFRADTFGAIWTQILAFANVTGADGPYICNSLSPTFCPVQPPIDLDIAQYFPKPKPANCTAPKASGKRVKVLHMSDFHLDPRYKVGSEGNCTSRICCRTNIKNVDMPIGQVSTPAPMFGCFHCDTPYDLGLAALQAVGPLTGTSKKEPLAWTIYTGDLVSHDPQSLLSRAYVEYTETSVFEYLFKTYLTGPVFPVLGNHDTNPVAINAPHSLPDPLGQQMSWNVDHVSKLWKHEGWIGEEQAKQARLHYGAYSIKNHYGLRMITFNSDFWYKSNFLNLINTTNPDLSGSLKFVIDELQAAEDAGERVWLFAHVLSGWDGTNPTPNPTNLFYQIIDRYSPHVIANVFFGHTHEDQVMIYYANNGTDRSRATPLTPGWIGPSVTPVKNVNSGFRLYEVDTGSFDVYEAYTFVADVNSFPNLTTTGPTFAFEYSTRDTYGPAAGWPEDAPLNGTFWHAVTEAMEKDRGLVSTFNTLQGKSSVKSPNCTSDACAEAKICYIRSGSVPLGRQCPQGYGSVQSAFTPKV
ncbi:Putative calcineurin-like phosphoesterase domain, ApaH type, metallo-dependent phosphatase [Septoria linicola]|uniref:Calcineurin-like phosphoesterase domain, ApaH type, metallo-dependent phosphatase n=1 Tax=Septoria linicola TaxID=215465 RepID=A0A9Q9AUZ6_9PEZI|nr:putative calcineurin-like phosphoesterase domain, ApaH type, metallo-dependent phosphatase [Septoria linicola]USW53020.1 Putative calcineurin-like phosphoesterase domain, ApaH type, metallo-dependent phosphatase [Septoria linicola]